MPVRKRWSEAALNRWNKRRKSDSPASTTPSRSSSYRPKTLKQWEDSSMCDAIEAVKSRKCGQLECIVSPLLH